MKAKELKELTTAELNSLLREKKAEVGKLRFDISSKQLKEHRDIRKAKKEVAKILTILKQSK